ncbi:MAG: hypothetical protein ACFFCM_15300 [Promethearchaeota archaeon]
MKVKECDCYKSAMKDFLDKRMLNLRNDIENEVKKVLGMNFLGMITDYFSNTKIMEIFKIKCGRLISTFILLKKPIIEKKNDLHILHIKGCPKIGVIEEKVLESEINEEGVDIPID